jgi:hypothetical protein
MAHWDRTNRIWEVAMPAKSKAQQRLFAIAEHEPSKLMSKNKGLAKLSKGKLSEFASTSTKGLPAKVKK